jgi:hypothetical protein
MKRSIAIILFGVAIWAMVSKSSKEKRRHFSGIVRREVIQKQKGKCASCKRKLLPFGMELDHKTVTVLTTSLPTARYCALRAIRENIYKLNHIFRENIAHYWSRIAWISDLDHLQQTWK